MKCDGERFLPDHEIGENVVEHFQRYRSVLPLIKGKVVLDSASGEGYGSFLLSEQATKVYGVDIDADAVAWASKKYVRGNLSYQCASIASLPLADCSVDAVVSFETIEHVDGALQAAFLREVKRVLKEDGVLIISTPDKLNYSDRRHYDNEFHVKEFYVDEFAAFLKAYFSHVQLYRQGVARMGMITALVGGEGSAHTLLEKDAFAEREMDYVIAVCGNHALRDLSAMQTLYGNAHRMASLYINSGKGYNEEEKLFGEVARCGDRFRAYFALPCGMVFERLRFDPIEDMICACAFARLDTDAIGAAFLQDGGAMSSTEELFFGNADPMIEFVGDFSEATYIAVEYELRNLKTVEIARLCREDVRCEHREEDLRDTIEELRRSGDEARQMLQDANAELQAIYATKGYRLLEKLRKTYNLSKARVYLAKWGDRFLKRCGFAAFRSCLRRQTVEEKGLACEENLSYDRYFKRTKPSAEALERQKGFVFAHSPRISIIVPVFNPNERFLKDMVESVLAQTYSNWELCLADGSTKRCIFPILSNYARMDNRIKVQKLDGNRGISANSNAALQMATGEYVGLFDHDDLMTPDCLFEVVKAINENDRPDLIYTDEDKTDFSGERFFEPHFKPDFSPDLFRSSNYICHFSVMKSAVLARVGAFLSEYDGAQDYDLLLRVTEKTDKIVHIPKVLYHWRAHANSTANGNQATKSYTHMAGKRALEAHLDRVGLEGKVTDLPIPIPNRYNVKYALPEESLVSILIPNCNHKEDLEKCLSSLFNLTIYAHYEIVIVENNSTEPDIFQFYEKIREDARVKVVKWEGQFNYAAINNFGVRHCGGKYILFLNNDVEIITPGWIEGLLMYAQRDDVGAVGAKLCYFDDTVQHGGVIIGLGGIAGHMHRHLPRDAAGCYARLASVQNLSAVTGALLLTSRAIFEEVGGFTEAFAVAFNDVDFCMKVRRAGYLIVFNPNVEAYHYESRSRGEEDSPEKKERFMGEIRLFEEKWGDNLADPYYNVNLSLQLDRPNFSVRDV